VSARKNRPDTARLSEALPQSPDTVKPLGRIMHWISFYLIYVSIGWAIRIGMVPVILRRQMAPGASFAWLAIIYFHPYIGLTLYMLVGESRLGPRRAAKHLEIISRFRDPQRHPDRRQHETQPRQEPPYQPVVLQAEKISGLPVLGGNSVEFQPDANLFFDALIADIAAARSTVHLSYYIFSTDRTGRRVAQAAMEAAGRGVKCRVLADALASRVFFRHASMAAELRSAGVEVAAALPVAPIRRDFARMDMRNHRKLAVIDDQIAWIGSHNLIDPDYGGRRGNPWYDVTARCRGPIVGELAMVFAEDWAFETGNDVALPSGKWKQSAADVLAQAVPTGPSSPDTTYRRLLLAAIQCSRQQLILTTPYFVPDEPTILSMVMAADRNVDVKLILPQTPDHLFTAAAGRAHFQQLLNAGVSIYLYRPGLIHAKTATVDDAFCLFGSANLDVRSFNLNFEFQKDYLSKSTRVEGAQWARRPIVGQYADRAVSLMSPLL
jgi:cardiolipin synthase